MNRKLNYLDRIGVRLIRLVLLLCSTTCVHCRRAQVLRSAKGSVTTGYVGPVTAVQLPAPVLSYWTRNETSLSCLALEEGRAGRWVRQMERIGEIVVLWATDVRLTNRWGNCGCCRGHGGWSRLARNPRVTASNVWPITATEGHAKVLSRRTRDLTTLAQ